MYDIYDIIMRNVHNYTDLQAMRLVNKTCSYVFASLVENANIDDIFMRKTFILIDTCISCGYRHDDNKCVIFDLDIHPKRQMIHCHKSQCWLKILKTLAKQYNNNILLQNKLKPGQPINIPRSGNKPPSSGILLTQNEYHIYGKNCVLMCKDMKICIHVIWKENDDDTYTKCVELCSILKLNSCLSWIAEDILHDRVCVPVFYPKEIIEQWRQAIKYYQTSL